MRLLLLTLAVFPGAMVAQQTAPIPNPSTPVKIGGYLQTRLTYQSKVGMVATINRARLTATGTIASGFSYRIQGEFRTGNVGTGKASVSLTDAYIRWSHQAFGVQLGQFKTPFTREYLASIADIESLDRSSVVDSLAPKRDIGIMADYQFGKFVNLSVGAFNGDGQNVTSNRDSSVLGVTRMTIRPIPELAISGNLAAYFGDSLRYGADVSFENKVIVARGEYVAQSRDSLGGKDDWGWFGLGGVRVMPTVQLVGKYEEFRREQISAQQHNRAWSAGVNWYVVTSAVRLSAFYASRKIGEPGIQKGVLETQLQVRF
jgi:phosphate-selective porin